MLEYISAPEAAKKWGISERRVQKLCEENRIPGVAKFSRMWLIPKDAEKPIDHVSFYKFHFLFFQSGHKIFLFL